MNSWRGLQTEIETEQQKMANNYRKGIKRSYLGNIWLRETRKTSC